MITTYLGSFSASISLIIGHYTSRLEKTLSGMYSEIVTGSYSHFWLSPSTFYSALPFASFLLLSSVKLLAILQFLRLKKRCP